MNQRQLFLRHLAQTSPAPMLVEVAHAQGVYLHAPDGKRYIDMISGIGVANVGHSDPDVVAAVQQQAALYMHTMVYGEFVQAPQVQYAHALAELLGPRLSVVYFTNSGAEAVEGALKLAKRHTGRTEIVAFERSYHGSTHGALSVTGADWIKQGYGPLLPQVHHIRFNHLPDLARIHAGTACVIVEAIRGEAGVELPEAGYLEALQARCRETGALLILDEIQTGFGRTGSLFAHQALGIEPDVLLLAKSLGGGMPLGAFIARPEVMQALSHDPVLGHITTFGGHPVSCAAGLAALRKIQSRGWLAEIPAKEAMIRSLVDCPGVLGVRGKGMMFAVELGSFEKVLAVIKRCMENGLITDWFLHCDTAIRLAPPLVITEKELAEALSIIRGAIIDSKGIEPGA